MLQIIFAMSDYKPVNCVSQVALGQVLHQVDELLPANSLPWDDIFAAVLLVFFGIKTLLVSLPQTCESALCSPLVLQAAPQDFAPTLYHMLMLSSSIKSHPAYPPLLQGERRHKQAPDHDAYKSGLVSMWQDAKDADKTVAEEGVLIC